MQVNGGVSGSLVRVLFEHYFFAIEETWGEFGACAKLA
jgi:hypothetical protein